MSDLRILGEIVPGRTYAVGVPEGMSPREVYDELASISEISGQTRVLVFRQGVTVHEIEAGALTEARGTIDSLREELALVTCERDDAYVWVPDSEGGTLEMLRTRARERRRRFTIVPDEEARTITWQRVDLEWSERFASYRRAYERRVRDLRRRLHIACNLLDRSALHGDVPVAAGTKLWEEAEDL